MVLSLSPKADLLFRFSTLRTGPRSLTLWAVLLSGALPVTAALAATPPSTVPDAVLLAPVTTGMAVRASLILLLFLVIAAGIALRKIPAMVALPVMALGIGIIAGAPLLDVTERETGQVVTPGILNAVLEGRTSPKPSGAFQLYQAIIYVIFGGMFARFISDARIAERIVKYAAEYGGENPFSIALLMSAITALVFTATGGLPMIIMLGTVMFPILLSQGVPPAVCGSLLLLAFPIGAALQPAEWGRLAQIFDVKLETVQSYSLAWASVQVVVLVTFLSIEFLRMKRTTVTVSGIFRSLSRIGVIVAVLLVLLFFEHAAGLFPSGLRPLVDDLVRYRARGADILRYCVAALLVFAVLHTQWQYYYRGRVRTQWNLLTPALPLVLLLMLGFGTAIVPAFLAALAYGFFTTPQERGMQKLGRSIINGVGDVAAPVVLMIGIGMLLAVATLPQVDAILTPILGRAIPKEPRGYVITFLLASPLSLYRGPLNSYGLGLGVAKLMSGPGMLPAPAVMGAMNSVGMLQDPTATQNVWICGYLKLDINALLFKLFFYSLILVLAGLVLSAVLFFPEGARRLLGDTLYQLF